jgi:hypothetical protein
MPIRRAVSGLVTALLVALAFTFPLVACGDDSADEGDADVNVTGGIESSWDGGSVYGSPTGNFALVLFDGDLPTIGSESGYDGELVAFLFFESSGNPGTGSYDVSSEGDVQAVYFDGASDILCFGVEGTLNLTSSVAGDFQFDASCTNEALVNVEGSFDAVDEADLDS